jgi:DNA-binding PadR family transcriptional regulator
MSTRLVILGLLRRRPLHGYEIKHIIEEHMGDWTSIAFGSIYFALNKLTEEEFVELAGTEQQGNRPSRTIYQITDAGRNEFMRLLRQNWQEVEHQQFDFDIALFFMDALSEEEIEEYLKGRVARLETTLEQIRAHRAEQMANQQVPRTAAAIFDHSLAHYEAELGWTRGVLQSIRSGQWD